MAHTASQKKHIRLSEQRRQHNVSRRSMMKTFLKKAGLALQVGPEGLAQAQEAFKQAQTLLDRFATKGLIHKNKAARHKSHLALKLHALSLQSSSAAQSSSETT